MQPDDRGTALNRIGLLSNRAMLGAIGLTVGLQLVVVYLPVLQAIFNTTAMPLVDLLVAAVAGLTILLAVEAWKWALRGRSRTASTLPGTP